MSDDLPAGWAATTLKAGLVSNIQTGFACGKHSRDARGIAHLRPMNVSEDGRIVLEDVKYIDPSEVDCEERWLRRSDVVFNNTNSPELVGKTALYELDEPRAFSNHMTRLRCADAIDAKFCALLLHHRWQQGEFFEKCNNHVSQASVGREVLLDTELCLPPLPEQHRIVAQVEALLEQVTRARARLDRVRLILKRFRQGVLAAACSGELTREWRKSHPDAVLPVLPDVIQDRRRGRRGANLSGEGALLVDDELPELPEPWSYVRLDRLTEPGTVITYGIVLPGPEIPGGVPYVRGQDVEDGRLRTETLRHTTKEITSKHERSSLRAGDILLCIIRNLRVAVVPKGVDGANITQGMVRIRTSPAVVLRDFIASYLMSPLAQGWMKRRYFGMDMPRINVEDARAIPVALPPLEEQAEIVRQVQKVFALVDDIERRVAATSLDADHLPKAILSKAFSGELVPTEAELARAEGRTYETAEELLARVRREQHGATTTEKKSSGRGHVPKKLAGAMKR
jgi:type I restriction enzyme S subunit